MRVDPETWDNIYDVPAELAPVIEELTKQNNAMKEAISQIYRDAGRVRAIFDEYLLDGVQVEGVPDELLDFPDDVRTYLEGRWPVI